MRCPSATCLIYYVVYFPPLCQQAHLAQPKAVAAGHNEDFNGLWDLRCIQYGEAL